MGRMSIEVRAEKDPGYVTKGQVLDLIAQANAAGAPDNAAVGVDVLMEFSTPVRIRRFVISWDPQPNRNADVAETANPS